MQYYGLWGGGARFGQFLSYNSTPIKLTFGGSLTWAGSWRSLKEKSIGFCWVVADSWKDGIGWLQWWHPLPFRHWLQKSKTLPHYVCSWKPTAWSQDKNLSLSLHNRWEGLITQSSSLSIARDLQSNHLFFWKLFYFRIKKRDWIYCSPNIHVPNGRYLIIISIRISYFDNLLLDSHQLS